jgi:hypothetical protein
VDAAAFDLVYLPVEQMETPLRSAETRRSSQPDVDVRHCAVGSRGLDGTDVYPDAPSAVGRRFWDDVAVRYQLGGRPGRERSREMESSWCLG